MTFSELKNAAIKEYYPALFLERLMPHHRQDHLRTFAWGLSGGLFILTFVLYGLTATNVSPLFDLVDTKILGLFLISLPLWMMVVGLQAFHYSFYFKEGYLMQFELAHILYRSHEHDLIVSFLKTKEGKLMMKRAGLTKTDLTDFINNRKSVLPGNTFSLEAGEDGTISVLNYVGALFDRDQEFAEFMFSHGIQKKDFEAISRWVVEREISLKRHKRWWSRDRLGRIPGIGKNWSYGNTFYLDDLSTPIPDVSTGGLGVHSVYGSKELEQLEAVLAKEKGANAILIGDDKEGEIQIIARLNHMIEQGTAYPEIEHSRIVMFEADLLTASVTSKPEFENKFLGLMNEGAFAGNVILVFPDFPGFMASAQSFGSDIVSLLDRYLTSNVMNIVAFSNTEQFHNVLERNVLLMQRMEKIYIQSLDSLNTVRVLENEIISLEKHNGVFFTYPALLALSEGAARYFPDAQMPDRAIELLYELAPINVSRGKRMVTAEDAMELITSKTGIPVGKVDNSEREKLINLEKILHQRIIGQDEAVTAIANAVRRARSGINNPNRPLASFLFLGPTGVGKTESTKALADAFFGAEAKIERLDMSEYTSMDAISKLIGSRELNQPGVLSNMLREQPYGVLLLDEFEKTTPEVMNLFLSILDEGFFSDMSGKKINTRNMLIIATSNAGADIIWESLKEGTDFSHAKELIIDAVIKKGIFKPELINRFDGVIVFHPLTKNDTEKVARLQLEKLQKRLAERGIKLAITDDLVQFVVGYGTDPKFGARPMNRAIQDKVEQIIADKLISGNYRQGALISLTTADLSTK